MSTIYINSYAHAGATWYDGLTDLVAVYQPIGAASLAASYVNLVNPGTFDAAPGVAPTWDAGGGWTFNGSTQYLTTGVVPSSGYSMIIRFSGVTISNNNHLMGETRSGSSFSFQPATGNQVRYFSGSFVTVAPGLAAGVLAIAGQQGYRNGVAEGGAIPAWGANPAWNIFIGCLASGTDSPSEFISANIQAVAICSSTQTADQIATASAAMAAL